MLRGTCDVLEVCCETEATARSGGLDRAGRWFAARVRTLTNALSATPACTAHCCVDPRRGATSRRRGVSEMYQDLI